ncbi:MAG: hypothetical protein FWF24_01755 [Alphaproteobacteria bacterium]|nr:hypothetical protein [Alphaproteobacteria bacterium]
MSYIQASQKLKQDFADLKKRQKLQRLHDKAIPRLLVRKKYLLWLKEEQTRNFLQKTHTASGAEKLQDDLFGEWRKVSRMHKNLNRHFGNLGLHSSALYWNVSEYRTRLDALRAGFRALGGMLVEDRRQLEREEHQKKPTLLKLGGALATVPTAVLGFFVWLDPENRKLYSTAYLASGAVTTVCVYRNPLKDAWKNMKNSFFLYYMKETALSFFTQKESPATPERNEKLLNKKNISNKLEKG